VAKQLSEDQKNRLFIQDLNKMHDPHPGQMDIGRAIFVEKKRLIFAKCGRKFGKSWIARYASYRKSGTQSKLPTYIILPVLKQAKEIYWAGRQLQDFIHPRWIEHIDNSQCRITLWNKSFIKLDGSDNTEMHRGPECGFFVGDEMKDFDIRLWPAMLPNLLVLRGQALFLGTPPDNDIEPSALQYLRLSEECESESDCFLAKYPSSMNPKVPQDLLEKIRDRLIANGEEDVWLREYMAEFVKAGHKLIFPMFDETKHVFSYEDIMRELKY